MNHHVIAPPMSQVARAPRCRRGRSARWACAALLAACLLPATYASEVLKAAGVSGGLCVHLGCGDGTLVTAIAGEARFIVHGLEADAAAVERTRKVLSQRRLFGQASVEQWDAKTLPYADNVVNLLITDLPTAVPQPEIMRVLAPGGVWCRREGVTWQRTVKPKPAGMDEWPQWRHGADRNPVSQDDLVDVPQRTQWLSFQGNQGKDMLTNGGRNYTLVGGLLRVRDAFNGLPLWNAKVDGKCRAVALVDGVLVVDKGKLVRLDGGTGRLVRTYDEAGTPNVILHVPQPQDPDGVLVVADGGAVTALAGATGKTLWRATHQFPRGLSIGAGLVYLISGDPRTSGTSTAMALDLMTGKARWERSDLPWSKTCYRTAFGNGTLAFECGRFAIPPGMDEDKAAVTAIYFLQAADGKTIRDYKYMPAMRHDETPRAFFLDSGRLAMHQGETKDRPTALALFDDLTRSPTLVPTAYARRFPLYCHPPVATERFFIYGEMGFTDWKTFKHRSNPITRGSCGRESEGLVPANGLVYVFPKSCSCFSMLNGVAALAPPYDRTIEEAHPLVKGPAFGVAPAAAATKDEWATYRGDVHRSGSVARTVPPKLQPLWTATPEQPAFTGPAQEEWKEYPFATGPLTPPVIAQGLVVVAQPHTHRVLAFKAEDGKPAWEFTANGRIDSAPTISDGLCLFGSRTGWVYCLKASDGQLVWRLRIAPADLRIVHCGQVESPWPVAGSVLVSDGVAYVSAGVHPLTDGGMRVCAVDPRTGSITWKQIVTDMGYNDHAWRGRMGLDLARSHGPRPGLCRPDGQGRRARRAVALGLRSRHRQERIPVPELLLPPRPRRRLPHARCLVLRLPDEPAARPPAAPGRQRADGVRYQQGRGSLPLQMGADRRCAAAPGAQAVPPRLQAGRAVRRQVGRAEERHREPHRAVLPRQSHGRELDLVGGLPGMARGHGAGRREPVRLCRGQAEELCRGRRRAAERDGAGAAGVGRDRGQRRTALPVDHGRQGGVPR
jgi:outer membrane protein assembly factor BamB